VSTALSSTGYAVAPKTILAISIPTIAEAFCLDCLETTPYNNRLFSTLFAPIKIKY
jgi:hypothetical protein